MRKKLFKIAVVLGLGVVIIALGVSHYISSTAFSEKASALATQAIGIPVTLKENIKLRGIFPNITIAVPHAHLSIEDEHEKARIRFSDVTIALSTASLLFERKFQDVQVEIGDVSAIVTTGAHTTTLSDDMRQLPHIVTQLREVRKHEFLLGIATSKIIHRSGAGTITHQFSDMSLDSSQGRISLTGNVLQGTDSVSVNASFAHQKYGDVALATDQLVVMLRGKEQPQEQAITLHANISEQNGELSFTNIAVTQGKNHIEGALELSRLDDPKANPLVTGQLNIKRFDLAQWVTPRKAAINKTTTSPLVFDRSPIDYHLITHIDSEIDITAGAVRMAGNPLVNGRFRLTTNVNSLSLVAQEATTMGAPLDFTFVGKKLDGHPYFSLNVVVRDADVTRIGSLVGQERVFDRGHGQANIRLAYHGATLRDHAETLDGTVALAVADAHLSSTFSTLLDKGIVSHAKGFATKNSAAAKNSGRDIPCINAYWEIANGYAIVDESILIETPDNLLISTGYMDFHTEQMNYTFASNTKKFLDWSPLGMVKYLRVTGAFATPVVSANEDEVAKKGALTVVSIFAGPIPGLAYSAVDAARKRKNGTPECHTTVMESGK